MQLYESPLYNNLRRHISLWQLSDPVGLNRNILNAPIYNCTSFLEIVSLTLSCLVASLGKCRLRSK